MADSSAEAKGNEAASASVSKLRRWPSASTPTGRVVVQPCSVRQVAGWASSSIDAHTRAHPGALGLERLLGSGVHGEVEPDPEQLLLAPGQAGRQVAGIGGGHLDLGIAQASLGGVGPAPRFEAGQLAAQAVGGDVGRDGLDVHGDVEAAGVGGERLEPAEAHLAGVADDGEAPAPAVPDPQRPGPDLDGVGAERRGGPGGRARASRASRRVTRASPFWRARVTGSSVAVTARPPVEASAAVACRPGRGRGPDRRRRRHRRGRQG